MAASVKSAVAKAPRSASFPLAVSVLLALVSAVLLDFCFPIAGPMPRWRSLLAWIALVPLLYALLNERAAAHPRYLRRAALTGYLSGVLWYILNCYWIYQTMLHYGNVPPLGSAGIVVLFSLVLGLYFGLFGLLLAFFHRRFSLATALVLAPFLWVALDLAAARITSVPWDQLGYSQVDNFWLNRLAPRTGVYGITWFLVLINTTLLSAWIGRARLIQARIVVTAFVLIAAAFCVLTPAPPPAPTSDYAVLIQPNIDVAANDNWQGTEWDGDVGWLVTQARKTCTPAYLGLPEPDKPVTRPQCIEPGGPPGVVLWPEVGSWFRSNDPRTIALISQVATAANAPFIAGMVGADEHGIYNSAVFVNPDGAIAGRYDKIHLVPFGEYIPYRSLFFFAHHLTNQVGDFNRGTRRNVFEVNGHSGAPGAPGVGVSGSHTYGVFICYESVFADEIRHFALNGAQVLVNISDDGWYGDTSAPWQHLNMARMRAIENDRWLLRDTNNGVTTVIDPTGRVTLSAPRHMLTSLVARYGYRSDLTFYTRHGDVFAWICCIIVAGAIVLAFLRPMRNTHA